MSVLRIDPGTRMSQATVYGGLIYTAGQVDVTGADVRAQAKIILAKIDSLLERAGSDKSQILFANVWLADIGTFAEMNAVWEAWIDPKAPPARATVEAKLANPDYKIEIAVVAATAGNV